MATMIIRSLLALFVCASLAACSANKDSSAPVHVGTNAKTQTQQQQPAQGQDQVGRQPSPDATANNNTDQTAQAQDQSKDNNNKDQKAAKSDTQTKAADTKAVAKDASKAASQSASSSNSNSSTAEQKAQTKAAAAQQAPAAKQQQQVVTQTTKSQAGNTSAAAGAHATEKVQQASLSDKEIQKMKDESARYTGSADDYLRNYLVDRENGLSEKQQKADLQMANAIQSASLGVDYDSDDGTGSGDVIVRLSIKHDNKETSLVMGGELDSSLHTRLQVREGSSKVKGELICLDRNDGLNKPTCETALVDIRGASGATVKVIFRRTNMIFSEHFDMKNCTSPECYDIYGMFSETHAYQQGFQKSLDHLILQKAKMETFEVINGRSAFRVLMLTTGNLNAQMQRVNKQLIVFGAPLYNQNLLSSANPAVAADRQINPEDQMNYRTGANYKTDLDRTLKDIRITSNDGVGNISALITIGSKDPNLVEQFQLDISRKLTELRPMENMQLK